MSVGIKIFIKGSHEPLQTPYISSLVVRVVFFKTKKKREREGLFVFLLALNRSFNDFL